ncbi:MAG: 2-C-methyl-D-erythritol 4-phosphate cytidylyltransferase, partial [Ethanoligenens sp.]
MERNVKTVAIILAGGSGTRFGSDVPKQFTKLSGRTILERTIDIFEKSNSIDEIIIVSISDYFFHISNMINNNK